MDALASPDRAGLWPYVLVATCGGFVFGWTAILMAQLLAAAIIFVLIMPLTALALNRGQPLGTDQDPFGWNPWIQHGLMVIWVNLSWLAAWTLLAR